MSNNIKNVVPASIVIDALEPVARDLCRLVVLNPDAVIEPVCGMQGLPPYKNWQVVAHRMLIGFVKQMPGSAREEILRGGIERLSLSSTWATHCEDQARIASVQ